MNIRNGLILPVLGVALVFLTTCSKDSNENRDSSEGVADSSVSAQAELEPPKQDSIVIVLDGADSVSVFDLLRQEHQVEFESSLLGVFVSGIDSAFNGGGYFWVFAVNDTAGNTAADKRLTSDGDRVTWHFRKMGD